ncbi:AAA family ATPase [Streptomyces sp. NPDC059979]|uniref:AAA family ATPase n=1 Tax=Streptomyces sp. NPDC059979 TaxID=3347021 RepID=UPI003691E75C
MTTHAIDPQAAAESPLAGALWLAQRKFAVFTADHPGAERCAGIGYGHDADTCTDRGKHPAEPFTRTTYRDEDQVRRLFAGQPRNVGVFVGGSRGPNGEQLLVMDSDRPGALEDVAKALGHDLPRTMRVNTAKGHHDYLWAPADVKLGNGLGSLKGKFDGDVRAGNAYVIGPGSLHATGVVYALENPDQPPVAAPAWLLEALQARVSAPAGPATDIVIPADRHDVYTRKVVQAECDAITRAPDGDQNNAINTAAFSLGSLAARGALTEAEAREALLAAARAGNHPEGRARATIDSGLRAGMAQPRHPWPPPARNDPPGPLVPKQPVGSPLEAPAEAPEPDGHELTSEEYFEKCVAAMANELLDTDGLDKIKPLEPLLGDLLHRNTLARAIGPSGTFKSFVLLDMCGHIGTGIPWHGQYVRQGLVIYLVAEGAEGMRKRVRAWEQHHGIRMDNIRFLPRPVQAMAPEWEVLTEVMRRMEPVLIVVDTQARVTVGIEENSNTEMGRVVARLDRLREVTGACVTLVHHTGHQGEHGRGASAVKGALHSELMISRKGDRLSNYVLTVKSGKQKDEEEGDGHLFGLQRVSLDGEFKPDGRPVTSLVLVSLDAVPDREPLKGSVDWIIRELDNAGVPSTYGRDRLRGECMRLEIEAKTSKLEEVARVRKGRAQNLPPDLPPPTLTGTDDSAPAVGAGAVVSAGQTCPAGVGAGRGQVASDLPAPSPSLRRGQVGQPASICVVCDGDLDTEWASQGHDRHVMC